MWCQRQWTNIGFGRCNVWENGSLNEWKFMSFAWILWWDVSFPDSNQPIQRVWIIRFPWVNPFFAIIQCSSMEKGHWWEMYLYNAKCDTNYTGFIGFGGSRLTKRLSLHAMRKISFVPLDGKSTIQSRLSDLRTMMHGWNITKLPQKAFIGFYFSRLLFAEHF